MGLAADAPDVKNVRLVNRVIVASVLSVKIWSNLEGLAELSRLASCDNVSR